VEFVTPAMGSGVSLCEARSDLQSPQVLFAKLHFRTGSSECHVVVQEGGFGRCISVLVCYIGLRLVSRILPGWYEVMPALCQLYSTFNIGDIFSTSQKSILDPIQRAGWDVQKSDTTPTLESGVYIYTYTIQVLFKCTSNSCFAWNV